MELNMKDMKDMVDFLKWKRNHPEDYKLFLGDMKDFFKDMTELMKEVM